MSLLRPAVVPPLNFLSTYNVDVSRNGAARNVLNSRVASSSLTVPIKEPAAFQRISGPKISNNHQIEVDTCLGL